MLLLTMWRRSRGLAVVALLVVFAMIVTFVLATISPHGTFAVFAPQLAWLEAGVLIGLFVATDVFTRSEKSSGESSSKSV